MANIRAMAIFHGPDDLSADRIVNTFHFISSGTYDEDKFDAAVGVDGFYTGVNSTRQLGAYMSPWVQRDYEIRTYDLAQPKNARPPTITPGLLPAVTNDTGLPEECAVVLSLTGVGPLKGPRRRGRLFFGPLTDSVVDKGNTTGPCRPSDIFIADLRLAASRLMFSAPGSLTWVIRSVTPTENFVIIGDGYIDNAMDTQRRRGPVTTERTPVAP